MEKLRLGNRWRKSILLFVFVVLAMCFSPTVQAADEATIYGVGSSDADKVTIPADCPQSYQISAGAGGTYRVTKGDSAKVSASGAVTPRYTYWKRNSNFSISVSEGEPYDYYTLNEGDTCIEVKTASGTYMVTVHVKDYTDVYCDKVIDDYIKNNITAAMSDREKLEAITRFPASYDYSPYYSGVNSMILNGGGDCWASTSAIIALCKKLNINAWSRNGNKDPGAGSGHMNAMAELNGVYYELEAGYSMSKGEDGYRPYDVSVRDSLFCYYTKASGLSVYQYDGQDTSGEFVIPASINGKTVVEISDRAFMNMDFTKVILPDTLTAIGDYAFSTCSNLQSIAIPAAVTQIGIAPFPNCNKLTDLTVSEQNESYTEEGGVIYSKDKTTLVTCPNASLVSIPETVSKIADYAFYYNSNLKKISVPKSVESLGVGAFGNCSSLKKIYLSTSVKSLGAYAFAYCNGLEAVCFYGDAPEFGSLIDGTYYDRVFYGCRTSAYYPEGNATWTKELMTGHDGSVTWDVWLATAVTSLNQASVTLEQTVYAYTGADITPTVTVTLENVKLRESVDYTVSYENNQKAGTATVTITGIGGYEGTVSTTFTIEGGQTEIGDTENTGSEETGGTETKEQVQYYDKKTGMTLSITGSSKNVTLVSVNSKKVKSSMVIPDTVKVNGKTYTITVIGKNAFKNNAKLTKIKLGSKVKTIEASAFYGCKKLKSVTLGKNVTKIGDKAFYMCKALTKIIIGSKVSKIGKQAFYNCSKLKSITIQTTKLTSSKVGSNAFKGIYSKAVIKVPKNKLKAYRTWLKRKGIGKKVTVKK